MTYQQLPLPVQLPTDETFATFVAGKNQEALQLLQQSDASFVYLWGAPQSGKSHLLHALCAEAAKTGQSLMYLPLTELLGQADPDAVLAGLANVQIVCLDDIDQAVADADWSFALFRLFNQRRDAGIGRTIVTAQQAASHLDCAYADVQSRLQWGLSLHLDKLDDDHKLELLQRRAKALGLVLRDDAAQFLIQRLGREVKTLLSELARLDQASMIEQRRLTIPFIKQVLHI